ncbi:Pvc16 family protein [Streptomyces sp. M10(2022)]
MDLVFDAPTSEWSARRNAPTVSIFLRDPGGRHPPPYRHHRGVRRRRVVTGRRTPPRWFELTYLLTAWTNRPQDEHRLLSEVLRCVIHMDALPARMLTGSLATLGLTVEMEAASGVPATGHPPWTCGPRSAAS